MTFSDVILVSLSKRRLVTRDISELKQATFSDVILVSLSKRHLVT